jgi:broad specificity phosphatase PhoE
LTRLIIVRHGRTSWNEGQGERLRGRADLDLDEAGLRQSAATAARLTRWSATAVYSSPLKRAMRTAGILAGPRESLVQPLDGLVDIDYGRWQGLSLSEAEADDPELYRLWLRSPHKVTFPGGESLEQVRDRATAALATVLLRHPEQTVVLVSHKVVCKVLLCHLLGVDNSHFWQIEQGLCAISIVEIEKDSPLVVLLNDTCHLKESGADR